MGRLILLYALMVALAGCTHQANSNATQPDLSPWLTSIGFSELALPSTAFGPGTLVTSVAGHQFNHPLRLAHICDPDFTVQFPPRVDVAASREIERQLASGVQLTGEFLRGFELGADAKYVESVSLKLTNVRKEHHSHEQLQAIVDSLGPVCRDLLLEFQEQDIARQTLQALRADLEYTVTFNPSASGDVRASIIRNLTAGISGSASITSESRIVGRGLYYGLVLKEI